MARRNGLALLGLLIAATLGLAPVRAQAADGTWNTTTTGALWSLATNWSGSVIADGSDATADFNTLNIIADTTVNLDSARTIGNLIFGDTTASHGWILANNGVPANILTLAGTTPTITVNTLGAGKNATISAVISGIIGLTKAGTGTLYLSGTNTFVGGVKINDGTLLINAPNAGIGSNAVDIAASGVLQWNRATPSGGNLTLSNSITGTGVLKIVSAASGNAVNTYLAAVGSFNGTVQLSNSGGNKDKWNANGVTAPLAKLIIDSGSQLFVSGADTFKSIQVTGTGNTETRGAIRLANSLTVTDGITMVGNTTIGPEGGTINGNITSGSGSALTLTVGTTNSTGSATINGTIGGGTGSIAVTKTETSMLILTGTNTYAGNTTVSGGTLVVAAPTSLPGWDTAAKYSVASGTSLVLGNSFSDSDIATMLGTGNFVGGSNFGFDTSAGNREYTMSQGGATGITKTGANTLTLSDYNFYTGKTRIQGGVLSVSSLNSVVGGNASSGLGAPITVANGTIDLGWGANTVGLLYTGAGETTDRVINLAGTTGGLVINQAGTGLLKFTSSLTATVAGAKTLTLQGSGDGEFAGAIVNGSGTTALTMASTGTWTLGGANTYTGATTVNSGVLNINGSLSGTVVTWNGGTLNLNVDNALTGASALTLAIPTYTLSRPNNYSGNTSLTGAANSELTITRADAAGTGEFKLTNTGGGTIRNLNLHIDGPGSNGLIAMTNSGIGGNTGVTYNVDVNNNGGGNTGNTIQIGGAGLIGNGTLNVTGDNGYALSILGLTDSAGSAGSITINPTTAKLTLGTFTSSSNNAKTLILSGTRTDSEITGVISNGTGTVAVTKQGTGTWTLRGNNTFTGAVTITAGALTITNSGALGTGTKTVTMTAGTAGNCQLYLDGSGGDIDLAAGKSFSTSNSSTNGTIFNVAGNNTIRGNFTLTAGGGDTWLVSNAGTLTMTGTFTPNTTARFLRLDGASNGTVSGIIQDGSTANIVGLRKLGAGTWTLSGANTYSATTTISAGALRANIGAGLSPNSNLILGGGVLEGSGVTTFNLGLGTTAGQFQWAATANGGFSANGGKLTVNIGGNVTPDTLVWGTTTGFLANAKNLVFGSTTANNEVEFQNPMDLGGAVRTIQVSPGTGGDFVTLAGELSNGSFTKTGTGTLVLPRANPTLSGLTTISAGTLELRQAGALGSSTLSLSSTGTLNLNASQVLGGDMAGAGVIMYSANNALSNHTATVNGADLQTAVGTLVIGSAVTTLGDGLGGTDLLVVNGGNLLTIDSPVLTPGLDRTTITGNLTLQPGAIITETAAGGLNAAKIANLGTANDLFRGLGADLTADIITVANSGGNTAYRGLSTDRSSRRLNTGTITVDTLAGDNGATLQGIFGQTLTLGNGAVAGSVTIMPNKDNTSATINIVGKVTLDDNAAVFGDSTAANRLVKFSVANGGTLTLNNDLSLGSGTGIAANVEVTSGGAMALAPATTAAIETSLTLKPGSALVVNGSGLNGAGVITVEGPLTVRLCSTNSLTNTTFDGKALQWFAAPDGSTVLMGADNINYLFDTFSPASVFALTGARTEDPVLGAVKSLTLNASGGVGGVLAMTDTTADGSYSSATPIAVGAGGGTFAAATGRTFTVTPNINAAGNPVTVGSATPIEGAAMAGAVDFTGAFQAGSLNVLSLAILDNAASNVSGDIHVSGNGSVLYLDAGGATLHKDGFLSPRLASTTGLVADRVADKIYIDNGARVELGLRDDTPKDPVTGRLHVTQPFIITGNVNPASTRSFWVNRTQGTVALDVTLMDVTIEDGGVFAVDENNTDVRAYLKLNGNATITQFDDWGLYDATNVTSSPYVPVTLTIGRAGDTQAVVNARPEGTIGNGGIDGNGVAVDLVNGKLTLFKNMAEGSLPPGTGWGSGLNIAMGGASWLVGKVDDSATAGVRNVVRFDGPIIVRNDVTGTPPADIDAYLSASQNSNVAGESAYFFNNVQLDNGATVILDQAAARVMASFNQQGGAAGFVRDNDDGDIAIVNVGGNGTVTLQAPLSGNRTQYMVGKVTAGATLEIDDSTSAGAFRLTGPNEAMFPGAPGFALDGGTLQITRTGTAYFAEVWPEIQVGNGAASQIIIGKDGVAATGGLEVRHGYDGVETAFGPNVNVTLQYGGALRGFVMQGVDAAVTQVVNAPITVNNLDGDTTKVDAVLASSKCDVTGLVQGTLIGTVQFQNVTLLDGSRVRADALNVRGTEAVLLGGPGGSVKVDSGKAALVNTSSDTLVTVENTAGGTLVLAGTSLTQVKGKVYGYGLQIGEGWATPGPPPSDPLPGRALIMPTADLSGLGAGGLDVWANGDLRLNVALTNQVFTVREAGWAYAYQAFNQSSLTLEKDSNLVLPADGSFPAVPTMGAANLYIGKLNFTGTLVLNTGAGEAAKIGAYGADASINDPIAAGAAGAATVKFQDGSTAANAAFFLALGDGADPDTKVMIADLAGTDATATAVVIDRNMLILNKSTYTGGTTIDSSDTANTSGTVDNTVVVAHKNGLGTGDVTLQATSPRKTTLSLCAEDFELSTGKKITVGDRTELRIGKNASVDVELAGGTLAAAGNVTLGGTILMGLGNQVFDPGDNKLTLSSAVSLGSANRTWDVKTGAENRGQVVFSGLVSGGTGAESLTVKGPGTLDLSGGLSKLTMLNVGDGSSGGVVVTSTPLAAADSV
ncbi:MAG: autotransporter-associated beta strand repeat-containing protein, partial [Planctomycetota bacterium]|nr:autotransporter-associated beta strand repeat-containing protein [Planctomycetota bacterium]